LRRQWIRWKVSHTSIPFAAHAVLFSTTRFAAAALRLTPSAVHHCSPSNSSEHPAST
jgi:hypothetical protein